MSYSLNEIEAHAKRASRGAGLSWGMAEEAAKAVRWLASHDLAGPALLCDVLTQNDGVPYEQVAPATLNGKWRASGGDLCPLAAGAALNDSADRLSAGLPIEMADVAFPLLILPFAGWAAMQIGTPVRVSWQNVRIYTDGDGIRQDDPQSQINMSNAATLTCVQTTDCQGVLNRPGQRGDVAADVWAQLDAFARRTYAPATEASRLLGAGAGRSDND